MRHSVTGLMTAFALATAVAAQTAARSAPAAPTDKLWKIEVSGLAG